MAENQVTVEGERRALPELFFVMATQNPIEFRGTYPLPEAQMDRFAMQIRLGYVTPEDEAAILTDQTIETPLDRLTACASTAQVLSIRAAARAIRISEELKAYIVALVRGTRTVSGVQLGASPRASLALMKAAQALALFDGSSFVAPEHIQELAVPIIAHRVSIDPQARFTGLTPVTIVEEIIKKTTVPA
jgi:MoxR-like ATPase